MSNPNAQNETGKDDEAGQEVHGVVEGPCPKCQETIPEGTLACPHCGYQRSFNQNQYDMLIQCSGAQDISEWNKWRCAKPLEDIQLEAADLAESQLQNANLGVGFYRGLPVVGPPIVGKLSALPGPDGTIKGRSIDLSFTPANLRGADLSGANLQRASLVSANLQCADLSHAQMIGTFFEAANLKRASLFSAKLWSAGLYLADLDGANLYGADLRDAHAAETNLTGADLVGAHLEGADLRFATVNGATKLSFYADDTTDFSGTSLASACIPPGLQSRLQWNIRRLGWREWYKSHRLLAVAARPFWWVSDYGRSACRILVVFAVLSLVFAAIYYVWAIAAPPGVVENLAEVSAEPVPVEVASHVVPFRALYFSVVTMTTLGFGDMHACPGLLFGHLLLTVQVVLGYVLLGALITRFAIMFQGVTVPWDRSPPPAEESDEQDGQ